MRAPFDIERHLYESIQSVGSELELFGVRVASPDESGAAGVLNRFRDILTEQFQKRRPEADAATWDSFASKARALVEQRGRADDELLRVLLATIDGL